MRFWVTCSGVRIGSADFNPEGVAHAHLAHTAAYAMTLAAAAKLGVSFGHTQYWPPLKGDFAAEAAARWTGGRLALEDDTGREVAVNNMVIIHLLAAPSLERILQVVADFRPGMARVEALLCAVEPGGNDRTRPAA